MEQRTIIAAAKMTLIANPVQSRIDVIGGITGGVHDDVNAFGCPYNTSAREAYATLRPGADQLGPRLGKMIIINLSA